MSSIDSYTFLRDLTLENIQECRDLPLLVNALQIKTNQFVNSYLYRVAKVPEALDSARKSELSRDHRVSLIEFKEKYPALSRTPYDPVGYGSSCTRAMIDRILELIPESKMGATGTESTAPGLPAVPAVPAAPAPVAAAAPAAPILATPTTESLVEANPTA